jgi:hypothetical protein
VKPFLVAIVSLLGAGLGCAMSTSQGPAAAPGPASPAESFELHPGEKATAAGGDLVITFLGVLEDSRCPKGEQCIQAGRVRLSFEGTPRGGSPVAFEFDTSRESEAEVGGFFVALVSLEPGAVAGRSISRGDYIAKVSVRRS